MTPVGQPEPTLRIPGGSVYHFLCLRLLSRHSLQGGRCRAMTKSLVSCPSRPLMISGVIGGMPFPLAPLPHNGFLMLVIWLCLGCTLVEAG